MPGNNKLLVNYQQQSFVLYDYAKRSRVGAQSCSYQAFAVIAFQWCFRGDHMTWNGLTEQKNELNRFNNELVSSYPGCQRLFMRGFWFRSSSPSHVKKNLWYPGQSPVPSRHVYTIIDQSRAFSKTCISESVG